MEDFFILSRNFPKVSQVIYPCGIFALSLNHKLLKSKKGQTFLRSSNFFLNYISHIVLEGSVLNSSSWFKKVFQCTHFFIRNSRVLRNALLGKLQIFLESSSQIFLDWRLANIALTLGNIHILVYVCMPCSLKCLDCHIWIWGDTGPIFL